MKLVNRLTLFFLAALTVVLAAFSVSLYLVARAHLLARLDEQATATLATLTASAEIEPDGLEWSPPMRTLLLRHQDGLPLWAVFDANGVAVDASPDSVHLLQPFAQPVPDAQTWAQAIWDGKDWRVAGSAYHHPKKSSVVDRVVGTKEAGTLGDNRYRTLVFVTAVPLRPVQQMLRAIALWLTGITSVVWLASAAGSRWVCRRALAPVVNMAEAAQEIDAMDAAGRLPLPAGRDELNDLALAFNGLLDRLQESFERQRRLTGEASHQLRTPLTAMLGQMEVALRRDRDPDEYRRALTAAMSQAGLLRSIVEGLLFLARADAESAMPPLALMDIAEWLPRHLDDAWSTHARFGDLHTEAGHSPQPVRAQAVLLGQVVDNLVENALNYSPPGAPVRIRLVRDAEWVAVFVEDRGPGIAPDDLKRVFEPFFRSDEARRRGVAGIGLGLAIAGRLVAAFGGSIAVESQVGTGSTFAIRLRCVVTDVA